MSEPNNTRHCRKVNSGLVLGLVFGTALVAPPGARAHEVLLGSTASGPEQPASLDRAAVADAEGLVGNSGQLSYQVPFELPPGRGGSTPELGLVYSSAHGPDLAGLGWSLTGLPVIRRVADQRGIRFEPDDELAFVEGGLNAPHSRNMLLVPDLRSGTAGAQFPMRQVGERAPRFSPQGTCGQGPCYWRMQDGQGNTYYFGGHELPGNFASGTAASGALWERPAAGIASRGILAWSLSAMVDADGNYYKVTYATGYDTIMPHMVDYSFPLHTTGSHHRVLFTYAAAAGRSAGPGFYTRRLSNVQVFSSGLLVRRYNLAYAVSPTSGRERLVSLREVGRDGSMLPPRTFQYQDTAETFGPSSLSRLPGGSGFESPPIYPLMDCRSTYSAYRWLVGDFNGDGFDDALRWYRGSYLDVPAVGGPVVPHACSTYWNGTRIDYSLGGPSGLAAPLRHTQQSVPGNASSAEDHDGVWQPYVADINGDGISDLVALRHGDYSRRIQYWLGSPQGLGPAQQGPTHSTPNQVTAEALRDIRTVVSDLDGDQRDDLFIVYPRSRLAVFSRANGSGFEPWRVIANWDDWQESRPLCRESTPDPTSCVAFQSLHVGDFDGDGFTDVMLLYKDTWPLPPPNANRGFLRYSLFRGGLSGPVGPPIEAEQPVEGRTWEPFETHARDLNGDGVTDLVMTYSGEQGLSIMNGVFEPPADDAIIPYGRIVRVALGPFRGQPGFVKDRIRSTSGYAFWRKDPFASSANVFRPDLIFPSPTDPSRFPPRTFLSQFRTEPADVDGDGLSDLVFSYRGALGRDLDLLLSRDLLPGSNPSGDVTRQLEPASAPGATVQEQQSDGTFALERWWTTMGDFNGDGLADHVQFTYGAGGRGLEFYFGSAGGLKPRVVAIAAPPWNQVPQTYPWMHELTGDFNGDGVTDLLFVPGTRDPYYDLPMPLPAELDHSVHQKLSVGGRAVDKLTRIVEPSGRILRFTYETSPRHAAGPAIVPRWNNSAAPERTVSDRRLQWLVREVLVETGSPPNRRLLYSYEDQQRLAGAPSRRTSLGFGRIRRRDDTMATELWTSFLREPGMSHLPFLTESFEIAPGVGPGTLHRRESLEWEEEAKWALRRLDVKKRTTEVYGGGALVSRRTHETTHTDDQGFPIASRTCFDDGECLESFRRLTHLEGAEWLIARPTQVASKRGSTVREGKLFEYDPMRPHRLVRQLEYFAGHHYGCTLNGQDLREATCYGAQPRFIPVRQSIQYDAYGNVESERDAVGAETRTVFDPRYRTHVGGRRNALGQTEFELSFDESGRPISFVDQNGATGSWEYDVFGRLVRQSLPEVEGDREEAWLDFGNNQKQRLSVRRMVDATSFSEHEYAFDGSGRVVSETQRTSTLSVLVRRASESVVTDQDSVIGQARRYRVRRVTDWDFQGSAGRSTEYWFDGAGRQRRVRQLDQQGRILREISRTDQIGREVVVTDALSRTTRYKYSSRGLMQEVVDALGQRTRFYRDDHDNLRSVDLPNGQSRTYDHDSRGRLRGVRSSETAETVMDYDDRGLMTRRVLPTGQELHQSYDLLGRLIEQKWTTAQGMERASLSYDLSGVPFGRGRLCRVETFTPTGQLSARRSFEYDQRGQLSLQSLFAPGAGVSLLETRDLRDGLGRLVERAHPNGLGVESRAYAAFGGPLWGVEFNGEDVIAFGDFDGQRRPRKQWLGGGLVEVDFAYGVHGTVEAITARDSSGMKVQDSSYGFDLEGNVTSVLDGVGVAPVSGSYTLVYDALDRLTHATGVGTGGWVSSFAYDPLGHLTQAGAEDYRYYSAGCSTHRCVELDDQMAKRRVRYGFDSAGFLQRVETDLDRNGTVDRVELFAFDGRGHLRTVTRDGRIVFRANYHEDGTRWLTDASNAAGATVRTVQPNDAVELRLRPGAAGLASTVRVHRSIVVTGGTGFAGQPSASAPGTYAGAPMPALPRASDGLPPGAFMVLRDRLGSADVVLDHQGAVLTDYNYAPFGRMMHAKSSGMDLEYSKYTDKPDDAAIEMQFFGARYYDPRLRRFISPDAVVPGGGADPQGFNPYAYNLNNPFRWVDPDGHAPDEPLSPGQPSSRWEAWAQSAGGFVSALELRYQAAKSAVVDSASAWMSDAWAGAQARMRGHLERQAAASSTPGQTDLVARPAEEVVRQEVTERGRALVGGGVDLGKDVVLGIGVGKAVGVGGRAFVRDFPTKNTQNLTAMFKSKGEAQSLARTKLGSSPVQVEAGKLRSADGRWQYRSKPEDLAGHGSSDGPHIHLERLDPETGEVLENWHLRWK